MKRLLVALMGVCAVGFGCGGGGDPACSFVVTDFTNGASAAAAVSVWNCQISGSSIAFSFYDDGTGLSSALGVFTWAEVGCAEVDATASNGVNQIRSIEGSVAAGTGSFTQIFPNGTYSTATCTIGSL